MCYKSRWDYLIKKENIMKKYILALLLVCTFTSAFAQSGEAVENKAVSIAQECDGNCAPE